MVDKAVVVISGGLDSSTLAHYAAQYNDVVGISFDYGQRHKKELQFAAYQLQTIHALDHQIVDLSFMTELLAESGSSLVTDTDVPEGHYGEESMKRTVVPNRNMVMLSIAASYAISIGANSIWTGVHAGDHFIYPDCRPAFLSATNAAIVRGNSSFGPIPETGENAYPINYIVAPFLNKSKNDIAEMAFALNVDIANTWSCYKGGDIHCGRCGTCVERLEAIDSTGKVDPTTYEDEFFWREALQRKTV